MVDNLSPEDRRKTMTAVRSKATKPERILWSMLAGMGLSGWRKNADDLLGKPDAAFDRLRIAVFVDGCFWHGCPVCKKPLPDHNREYWERKIARNVERDRTNTRALMEAGWSVIRIWEHEITSKSGRAIVRKRIRDAVLAAKEIANGDRGS